MLIQPGSWDGAGQRDYGEEKDMCAGLNWGVGLHTSHDVIFFFLVKV